MLSIINLLNDHKENKGKMFKYLRQLDKKELMKIYKNVLEYEIDMLYKDYSEETIITLIDIVLHRLTFSKNVLNVAPELKYKGKYPERMEKKISKIAEQLDKNGRY